MYLAHFNTQEMKERKVSALQSLRSGSESALLFYRRSENRSAALFMIRSAERERAPKNEERLMLCNGVEEPGQAVQPVPAPLCPGAA